MSQIYPSNDSPEDKNKAKTPRKTVGVYNRPDSADRRVISPMMIIIALVVLFAILAVLFLFVGLRF